MKDYLFATMWLVISCKINRSVKESKIIIEGLKFRFDNDHHFILEEHDKRVVDAFNYYLRSIKYLE